METPSSEATKTDKAKRSFLIVWTIVGGILLTGVLVYLFNILSVPIGIVIWSIVIVFCLRGPVNKLEKLGVPRVAGTTIAYVLMFVVLALVGLLMFSPAFGVGDQFTNLIESIPGYVQTIAGWGNDLYTRYADVLQNDTVQTWINNALDAIVSWASTFARDSANGVVAIGTGLVNTFVALGFALVVAFWILMELPQLGRECMRLVNPKRHEDLEMLHVTFTRVMGGYIKGTLLQCAIIGVGCVVLFLVIGMLMEANAAVVMMTPLLRPLMLSLGLSDIHFCMMMCVNLYIGLMTPPVGVCLLLGNQIAGARLERTLKDALPMLGLGLIVLLLVTYVPAVTEWIPSVLGS